MYIGGRTLIRAPIGTPLGESSVAWVRDRSVEAYTLLHGYTGANKRGSSRHRADVFPYLLPALTLFPPGP